MKTQLQKCLAALEDLRECSKGICLPAEIDSTIDQLRETLAKREWVGPKDDEWKALYAHHHDTSGHPDTQWGYEFAIQAKLKEKNT